MDIGKFTHVLQDIGPLGPLPKKGTQLANIFHLVVEQEVPLPALSVLPVMGT